MNIKWMVLIVIVLVLGLTAMELFVPRKFNADGTISFFGKKGQEAPSTPGMATLTEQTA